MDSLGEYEHVTAKQVEDLDEIDEDGESKTSREKYLQVLDTETEVKTGTSAVWISYCGGEGEKYRQLKALLGQNTGKQAQSSAYLRAKNIHKSVLVCNERLFNFDCFDVLTYNNWSEYNEISTRFRMYLV